ncbi:hypothetical protein EV421DRAFT_1743782 [Armillaria borealis]|uniref:Uncharacterized protein n=1 Tax=Armillaria borealis TaxID=47425 RepID=A0AA39MDX5_9AGAR|nr:hypothetical protein EV421DRAFT_1743782 [Armillaria borealis]
MSRDKTGRYCDICDKTDTGLRFDNTVLNTTLHGCKWNFWRLGILGFAQSLVAQKFFTFLVSKSESGKVPKKVRDEFMSGGDAEIIFRDGFGNVPPSQLEAHPFGERAVIVPSSGLPYKCHKTPYREYEQDWLHSGSLLLLEKCRLLENPEIWDALKARRTSARVNLGRCRKKVVMSSCLEAVSWIIRVFILDRLHSGFLQMLEDCRCLQYEGQRVGRRGDRQRESAFVVADTIGSFALETVSGCGFFPRKSEYPVALSWTILILTVLYLSQDPLEGLVVDWVFVAFALHVSEICDSAMNEIWGPFPSQSWWYICQGFSQLFGVDECDVSLYVVSRTFYSSLQRVRRVYLKQFERAGVLLNLFPQLALAFGLLLQEFVNCMDRDEMEVGFHCCHPEASWDPQENIPVALYSPPAKVGGRGSKRGLRLERIGI